MIIGGKEPVLELLFEEIDLPLAVRCQSQLGSQKQDFLLGSLIEGHGISNDICHPTPMQRKTFWVQLTTAILLQRRFIVNQNIQMRRNLAKAGHASTGFIECVIQLPYAVPRQQGKHLARNWTQILRLVSHRNEPSFLPADPGSLRQVR